MKTTDDVIDYLRDCVSRAESGALAPGYGIFARAYHRFTLAIIAFLPSGVFEDPAWIADFDVRFALRYKHALENPAARVRPWKLAFDACERDATRAIRHLMLGINAHMSYDLCAVLLEGIVDDRQKRVRDFLAVNHVIAHAVGSIQNLIETRYDGGRLRLADLLGMNVDELLTQETFADWRGRAWSDAMDILDGRLTLGAVEARVARRARWLSLMPF
jgi:hypothetical protein